jgi:TM2 domain-containing membrane protein YozV
MSENHPERYYPQAGPPAVPYNGPQGPTPPHAYPPAAYGHGYPAQPPYAQVAPKSPGLALLASFFVPGLGSLVIGRIGVGIGIMVGYFISFLLAFVLIGLPFMFGFWLWGLFDAYLGAKNWNARHGIIS